MGWGQPHAGSIGELIAAHDALDQANIAPAHGNLSERVQGAIREIDRLRATVDLLRAAMRESGAFTGTHDRQVVDL